MKNKLNENIVTELLKIKEDGSLHHRESQNLEFKESFNLAGLADYYRDFAAFANNRGGYIIFGVKDRPKRELMGLNGKAKDQFDKLDPEKVSGHLLEIFSGNISWEHEIYSINKLEFGVFYVHESAIKPIICKKNEGKDQILKNGEIYFRYGGRTQKIQYAELNNIINDRVKLNNSQWMRLVQKIGKTGPQSAAILDVEKGVIERNSSQILVVDEKLLKDIQFVKEGEFSEKKGEKTLKLVGNIVPIEKVEVIRKEYENKLKRYPLTSKDLVNKVKLKTPDIKQNHIYQIIRENELKKDKNYSDYVFRSNKQLEDYETKGLLPKGITSIYNLSTVEYIVNVYKNENN